MSKKVYLLTILLFCLINILAISNVLALDNTPTEIAGIIRQDTILTANKSPYTFNNVQLDENATLTIEPGVTISGGHISVAGTIKAIGSESNRIIINDTTIYAASATEGRKPYVDIEFATINVSDNRAGFFDHRSQCDLTLRNNIINSRSSDGIIFQNERSIITIEKNIFLGYPQITLSNVLGSVKITNNVFLSSSKDASILYLNKLSRDTIIKNNSFLLFGSHVNVSSFSIEDYDLSNNYWGTLDKTKIDEIILDSNDSIYNKATAKFDPVLNEPDSNTPIVKLPTKIYFAKDTIQTELNKSFFMEPIIEPADATDKSFTIISAQGLSSTPDGTRLSAYAEKEYTVTVKTVNGLEATQKIIAKRNIPIVRLQLNPSNPSINIGDKLLLSTIISPTNATNKSLVWESSDNNIATVDLQGIIIGVKEGIATITAKSDNNIQAQCRVTVVKPQLASIKFKTPTFNMKVGEVKSLEIIKYPIDSSNIQLQWASSNKSIATISNGKVKALKSGVVTITVTGSNGLKAQCKVTIIKK